MAYTAASSYTSSYWSSTLPPPPTCTPGPAQSAAVGAKELILRVEPAAKVEVEWQLGDCKSAIGSTVSLLIDSAHPLQPVLAGTSWPHDK